MPRIALRVCGEDGEPLNKWKALGPVVWRFWEQPGKWNSNCAGGHMGGRVCEGFGRQVLK